MKKLLLLICLLPMAVLAQTVIKEVTLPKLFVDSTTHLRTLQVNDPVPGAKKDKLAPILKKWLASNYTEMANTGSPSGNEATTIGGEGFFRGSCAAQRAQYDINATDRVATGVPPVDYKVTFTIKVIVADEKYSIAINNVKLELFNVNTPLEQFYTGHIPEIAVPDEQQGMDIGEMYVRMFASINLSLQDVGKSASKYIAKAKKKGDL